MRSLRGPSLWEHRRASREHEGREGESQRLRWEEVGEETAQERRDGPVDLPFLAEEHDCTERSSGLFGQLVGEFKVDFATTLNHRPRALCINAMSSS